MDSNKYMKEIKMFHNEKPLVVNVETGEIREVPYHVNNIPNGSMLFEKRAIFKKDYTNSWSFLSRVLSPLEFKVAYTLALLAKANTNSLEPLSDKTTNVELMKVLGISKNNINPILNKLFIMGVYAKFEVYKPEIPYTKYWVFNPYLSFMGKLIKSDVALLFIGTHCEKAFRDKHYSI